MDWEDSFIEQFFGKFLGEGDYERVINAIVDISELLKSIDESLQIIADRDEE